MSLGDRFAAVVTGHSRLVVAAMLVATLVVGSAAGDVDAGFSIADFDSDTREARAYDEIRENFRTEGENTTVVQVVVRGEDVLSKESLLETLRFQRSVREDPAVNATLRAERPTVGLANQVAMAAVRDADGTDGPDGPGGPPAGEEGDAPPSLDAAIERLESMSEDEVGATVERVLAPDAELGSSIDPYALLATDYEPGSTTATGRVLFVYQATGDGAGADLPADVVDAQLAIQDIATAEMTSTESFVFGAGIVDEESSRATGESFAFIGPIALLLILLALGVAYRDSLDVVLGLLGIALVLVWLGGILGWTGIGVTQILIAVPFLLIGLSIDYALHVVMRYREARADAPEASPRVGMRRGLAGVVLAIGAATFTTSVGFLANAVSPLAAIREFGIVSAAGITSAFLVFGLFLPALKLELDGLRERVGLPPRLVAFGRGGPAGRLLGVGADVARRAPVAVVALALVLAIGGGVAATDIDTSIDQTDFLPRDSPDWMDSLPGPFQPGDYDVRENALYLGDNFVQSREASRAEFLIEGPVTDDGTLDRIAAGRNRLANTSVAATLADGRIRTTDSLGTVESAAATNATVAGVVAAADSDDDGVPDENLTAVFDAVYGAAPDDARATIHRADGEYRSLRLSVELAGGVDSGTVTEEMRAIARTIEGASDLSVTATGQPIVEDAVQGDLLYTLVTGFLVTTGVILVFLTVIFRRRAGSLVLGAVVLVPVVLALAWTFGTMYVANIPFTSETAIIAAIGIGIGVDYAIHVGDRFVEESRTRSDPIDALRRTVRGTGGALLASAATTAVGFGVLVLALVPSLRRFGFVTAVAITCAFLASVLVLPSLLVLWDRIADPSLTEDETKV